MVRFEDLVEAVPEDELPMLDRADVDESSLTTIQRRWRQNGAVVLSRVIPDEVIDAYCDRFKALGTGPAGFGVGTPYMSVVELRNLCLFGPLPSLYEHLIGEPMGLHLNLTGWVSTERNFHADAYLNPPAVGTWYLAAWFALDEIDPRSGPFEYVPGSHRWPLLRREKVIAAGGLDKWNPDWPKHSERILTPIYEEKIAAEGHEVRQFLGHKGDVLVWHSGLLHRGSSPQVPGMERRAAIAHFSGLNHRPDMPPAKRWGNGYYFPL